MVQGSESTLQGPPSNALSTACLAYQHGGVSRIFGLIKLDDFGHNKRSHLQTSLMKLHLYGFLQLQQNDRKAIDLKKDLL